MMKFFLFIAALVAVFIIVSLGPKLAAADPSPKQADVSATSSQDLLQAADEFSKLVTQSYMEFYFMYGNGESVDTVELENLVRSDLQLNIRNHGSWPGPEVVNTGNGECSRAVLFIRALLKDLEENGFFLGNEYEEGLLFTALLDDLKYARENVR